MRHLTLFGLLLFINACGVEDTPQDFSITLQELRHLYTGGDIAKLEIASFAALRVATTGDDSSRCYYFIYGALRQQGDHSIAVGQLMEALKVADDPEIRVRYYSALINLYYERGYWQRAYDIGLKALPEADLVKHASVTHNYFYFNIMKAAMKVEDWLTVKRLLDQIDLTLLTELNLANYVGWKGLYHVNVGREIEAIRLLDDYLEANPAEGTELALGFIYQVKCFAYWDLREYVKAQSCLDVAMKYLGQVDVVNNLLNAALLELSAQPQKPTPAIVYTEQLVKLRPNEVNLYELDVVREGFRLHMELLAKLGRADELPLIRKAAKEFDEVAMALTQETSKVLPGYVAEMKPQAVTRETFFGRSIPLRVGLLVIGVVLGGILLWRFEYNRRRKKRMAELDRQVREASTRLEEALNLL